MVHTKNVNKPRTPYEAAKEIVNVLNRPEFVIEDTYDAVYLAIKNECPLTAKGLVLDYDASNGMLFADYGGGLVTLGLPVLQELTQMPAHMCINNAINFIKDDLNVLFKPTSTFNNFNQFRYFSSVLAYQHQLVLGNGQRYRFKLLDYFAVVREDVRDSVPDKVFYLTRSEAIQIIDTAIALSAMLADQEF